jgi:hypothetical protein
MVRRVGLKLSPAVLTPNTKFLLDQLKSMELSEEFVPVTVSLIQMNHSMSSSPLKCHPLEEGGTASSCSHPHCICHRSTQMFWSQKPFSILKITKYSKEFFMWNMSVNVYHIRY